ncbi:MAG: HD domain-containing protein [Planctomycetes bacterium]|nr:HD domain-containing protein [Planctomycetota bacterium]
MSVAWPAKWPGQTCIVGTFRYHVPMTNDTLNTIKRWFETYIDNFKGSDGQLHELLQLKVDHSGRVAQDARALAIDLDWAPEDIPLAEALGWLHDIGRFTQFKEHRTFHDAQSFDHGERARSILQQESVLSDVSEFERLRILMGVRWHNAKHIPQDLDANVLPSVQLIRDADKLDIFHVVKKRIQDDGFQAIAKMFPHVKMDGPINPEVVADFQMCRSSDFATIKSLNDFLIMALGWIYDINYAPTFQKIADRNLLSTLTDPLPRDDAKICALITQAEDFVASHRAGQGGPAA